MTTVQKPGPGNHPGDDTDAVTAHLRGRLAALMRQWVERVEQAGDDVEATDPAWRQRWYEDAGGVLAALRQRENAARERTLVPALIDEYRDDECFRALVPADVAAPLPDGTVVAVEERLHDTHGAMTYGYTTVTEARAAIDAARVRHNAIYHGGAA